jgi:hypothetical protein
MAKRRSLCPKKIKRPSPFKNSHKRFTILSTCLRTCAAREMRVRCSYWSNRRNWPASVFCCPSTNALWSRTWAKFVKHSFLFSTKTAESHGSRSSPTSWSRSSGIASSSSRARSSRISCARCPMGASPRCGNSILNQMLITSSVSVNSILFLKTYSNDHRSC